jgi:DNA-binding transcriptional ArsR family regulator
MGALALGPGCHGSAQHARTAPTDPSRAPASHRQHRTLRRDPAAEPGRGVLTKQFVNASMPDMLDVEVIEDPAAAAVALEPARNRLLAELAEPASAAALAARLGMPRQKVNYHLRALEAHRLVRQVDTRKWGGLTERRLVATASTYVVSPGALGPVASHPAQAGDRLSAGYLVALAARAVREVGDLMRRAFAREQRLATLSIDTEIRFRSASERAAFSQELAAAVADLAARYHHADARDGRSHRLVVLAHPLPQPAGGAPELPHPTVPTPDPSNPTEP